jgi:hypothetical protein
MNALASFLALLNPWACLLVQAVTMVEQIAPKAATPPTGPDKKAAAVAAVITAINVAPAIGQEVTDLQAAIKTNDPATVTAGIGHGIEMALSICRAFGIFSKAGIVQAAAPLATAPDNSLTLGG